MFCLQEVSVSSEIRLSRAVMVHCHASWSSFEHIVSGVGAVAKSLCGADTRLDDKSPIWFLIILRRKRRYRLRSSEKNRMLVKTGD